MQTADFNYQDFTPSQQNEADKQLLVKFFYKSREDKAASVKAGRPIFKEVEHIDIKIPGNRNGGACRPATDADRKRFPEHYRRFKERTEDINEMPGTPLKEWTLLPRSVAEELSFFNVYTVEQLASMADVQVHKFRGLMDYREKAKVWLEAADKEKPLWEMDQRNKQLRAEIDELKATLATLADQLENKDEDLPEATKKRRINAAVKQARAKAE